MGTCWPHSLRSVRGGGEKRFWVWIEGEISQHPQLDLAVWLLAGSLQANRT